MKENILFERRDYLNTLKKRIDGIKGGYRQNIAVIGDEACGKTTTVLHLVNHYHDNNIVFIYLDSRIESLENFVKRFIGVLLYNFLSNSGLELKEDLDFLVRKSQRHIPKTIEKINSLLTAPLKNKKDTIFQELLSVCESLNSETGKFCVVIFDEFQNLESLAIKNLYRQWSKALILQKHTLYILISSYRFKAEQILATNLSLLFGNFQIIKFEPFNLLECNDFISKKIGHSRIDRSLKDIITNITGGNPYYIDVIINELLSSMGALTQGSLIDTLRNIIFNDTGILCQRFNNCLKNISQGRIDQDYILLLYHISEGHNRLKDLSRMLSRQNKEIVQMVSRLQEFNVLTKSADFLTINDRMFSFWLKFVYYERAKAFNFNENSQFALFNKRMEEAFKEFMLYSRKPLLERAMELLNMFEDDVVQIEKKRLRLAHFREIKPLNFNGRRIKEGLLGRSSDSLWIMAFKNDPITEEDIREFALECRKYRHKTQKKIIVTTSDYEVNARLVAKAEKIWAWDTNQLNFIFDLFGKPRMVV